MTRAAKISIAVPAVVAALLLSLFAVWKTNDEFFRQFRSFSVTVVNDSDYDLVSVETGILHSDAAGNAIESGAKHTYAKTIKTGQKKAISPKLSLNGEGGIYLKYTDARGQTVQKTVCSYTESASGYSTVTIRNDRVDVKENCR
ncbi:hypothetical protein [Cohnella hashimotonis]|uniref:Uncharacterized protein n=1 Tax=Cohnella hashimotonis TaxID=2826895 RepID=A0ABT6TMN0_9BACL|nr:hypothetical protein [Cohnella hashimotonis]MDI4647821.1 hypothetical protein [Cohnella hashimotonis]